MAMTACGECAEPISSSANRCPKCGAKVPRTKWWLWVPLGAVALFIGYGFTIPDYVGEAMEVRKACEAIAPMQRQECQRIYDRAVAAGERGRPVQGHEAPIDRALVAQTEKNRAAEDASLLLACKKNAVAKRAEYDRLMRVGEYWAASLELRRCAELQNDAAMAALVADAEIKQYVKEIESKATDSETRKRAKTALLRDYPDVGKKYAKL